MAEFQNYALGPGFRPRSAVNTSAKQREYANEQIAQMQSAVDSNRIVDQQRIEDARFSGQNLKALSTFSQTLGKYYLELEKQTLKDKEIGAQYAAVYNKVEIPAEQAVLVNSEIEETAIAEQANKLEAEGKVLEAQQLRQTLSGLSRGVKDEKALLTDLRSRYPSDILALVNTPELSPLFQADPNAALAIATKIWIKNNGLQYTTKANFVGILGDTIRNTNSYVAQNAVSQTIKQEKEQTLAEDERVIFNSATQLGENPTQTFNVLSDRVLLNNNGIVTRAAANQLVAKTLFKGAEARGADVVDIIASIPIKDGEPNTTIGNTYPTLYRESKRAATDEAYKQLLDRRREELLRISKELEGVTDINERNRIITAGIGRLANDPEGQANLRDKFTDLQETQETFNTYLNLRARLAKGEVFTPEEIQKAISNGSLTQKRGNELLAQLDRTMKPGRDAYRVTVSNSRVYFNETLGRKVGFSVAPGGIIDYLGIKGKILSKDKIKLISTLYNNALTAHLKRVLYTLKYDGSQTPEEQQAIIDKAAQDFFDKEVLQASGRFYLGGLFSLPDWKGDEGQNYEGVKEAANQLGSSITDRTPRDSGTNNWSTSWNPDSGNWTALKGKYKPGDIIWGQRYTDTTVARFRLSGINDPGLVRFASDMGITPLQLINNQTSANNVGPLTTLNLKQLGDAVGPKPGNINNPNYKGAMWKGIAPLLNAGFTAKGSAYIMALTYQLSRKHGKDYLRTENFVELVNDPVYQIFKMPTATDRQMGNALQILAKQLGLDPYSYYSNDASSFLTSFYNQP